ncbi:MAG: HAD family hydrolase [candidate division Zixibacteria bacterium]|nr:HAD family hydrolase [candidate division Zixibacteria bacterium]
MKQFSYLVFDLDGTLIDSSVGVVDAVNYSLKMMNQPEQPPERIARFIGFPLSHMYREFTQASVEQLRRHFHSRAAEVMVASAVVLDGVPETLEQLHRVGYKMAIATTKIRRHVEGIVEKNGWGRFFDALVASDEVVNVKPAPDALRLAVERLGATPQRAIVVGDTINDVHAAHAVPMKVIAVESPYGGLVELKGSQPDYLIRELSELPQLLDMMNGQKSEM